MSYKPSILVFAGSARKESLNKKLARVAAAEAEKLGAAVTFVDFADYPMPIYDGDLQAASGFPEKATAFKRLLETHDGMVIASPEHNAAPSALLKNALDWASRPDRAGEAGLAAFAGKYAAILSASPGPLGGLRGLFALRELLQNMNVTVLARIKAVGQAHTGFAEDGSLNDEKNAEAVRGVVADLVNLLKKVKG